MKQITIITAFVIMMVKAEMDQNCGPSNLPKNVTFADCCQMKVEMIPADILQKCAAQFPKPTENPPSDDGKPMRHFSQMRCTIECAWNASKLLIDGKPDKNAIITQLSSKDPSTKSAVETAVNFCLNKYEKMPTPTPMPESCSILPMFMVGCIYGQLYKACGSQIVTGNSACTALTDFAQKCNWVPPMKHE